VLCETLIVGRAELQGVIIAAGPTATLKPLD
jgi:hypothetical protein